MQGQTDPVTQVPGSSPHLVDMIGIRKSFPGVQAIRSARFDLLAGEVHALVGENGAGKSTLIKILTGVHRADSGEITVLGHPADFRTPLDAQRAGIATIYQEFTLVPTLTVAANVFLGNETTHYTVIDSRQEQQRTRELLARLGTSIDPNAPVSELSPAQQQLVEIARALERNARVLVMDEPTAALAPKEVAHLSDILRELTARGMGVMFISHRLDEVLSIAHRITVMRDGETVATSPTAQMSRTRLIELMVGRPIDQEYPKTVVPMGPTCFEVRHVSGERVHDVSFTVRQGEILGVAGLMGAGRTDVARLIFGADPKSSGEILLHGEPVAIASPRDAIRAGICLLTEDRKLQGLVLKASAKDNFALPNLKSWSRWSWIDQRRENQCFDNRVTDLGIRVANSEQRAEELSGGNQQKLLVARWLETNSRVIMFDEPTRGIDVGAKYDMYVLIGELAAQGKALIVISSELPELLGICDRILVMRRGRISGEIQNARAATQEEIMALAV